MTESFFDDALGLDFSRFPDNADDALADNIVSQTQGVFDEPPQQGEDDEFYDPEVDGQAFPIPNATQSMLVSPPQQNINSYLMDDLTTVDGHGMWTSWTRVFDQPRYACLDLLDNCLDATLHPTDFDGKVVMKRLPPNGIVILNNSSKPIKSLKDVLIVYGSTKGVGGNAKRDAIGENGVGLKHGCATLSNTSFVLTRNENVYSMGVIAKTLQTREGVCLPSFEFVIENPDDKSPGEIENELYTHLQTMITQNPKIAKCVQIDLGQGDLNVGIKTLVEHCQIMWNETWEPYDHVFQVLITSLLHSHNTHVADNQAISRRAFQGNNPAAMFLQEIKDLLPKFYINIPLRGFEFVIEHEKIQFSYWQHRLVELTKFNVHIPKETPIHEISHLHWDKEGYPLSIYCGFEALRVSDRDQANAAHMYIYSRSSGRLIQIDDDARATLGLAASGSDYQQGLTIIIDDVGAELPLMPTKQGIAWSEQRGGETHKRNLMTWAAGVAFCYWNHHAKTFQNRCGRNDFKTLLNNAVMSMADPITRHLHDLEEARTSNRISNNPGSTINRSMAMERLELADFTWFRDVDWKKTQVRASMKWKITKTFGLYNKLDIVEGSATIFKFTKEHYPVSEVANPARQHVQHYAPLPDAAIQARYAQMRASVDAQLAMAVKKRRLSNGAEASKPILLLDDEDEEDARLAPSPIVSSNQNGIRRQVARKSTGAPSPLDLMRNGGLAPQASSDIQTLHIMEMKYRACQAEVERQKQMMLQEQRRHHDHIAKLQHELNRAHHFSQQQNNMYHQPHTPQPPPPNYNANLQSAKDDLIIVKRQKAKLEEDLQEVKNQRATEVSGLNLEIEGLRMKLEQQDELIRKLQRDAETPTGKSLKNGTAGYMTRRSMLSSTFQGTDAI